jgi:predicted nucleic acid-binding Zn ribbon protein
MSLTPIAKIAIDVQTQPGWEGVRDWGLIIRAWESTVSPAIACHSRPKSISREILSIATDSASLAHQLTFGRRSLCHQLNNRLAATLPPFVDLRFAPIGYSSTSTPSAIAPDDLPIYGGEILTCPHCSGRSREGELLRWGVCQFCAIDLGRLGSR